MFKKKGFTLVEMMIVIVIIGVLAAALIPKLIAIQSRARDLQRRVDIQNIASALMLYYTDHNTYPEGSCNAPQDYITNVYPGVCRWNNPGVTTGKLEYSLWSGFLTELEGSYLKSIPKDPQHEQLGSYSYYFDANMYSADNNFVRLHCNTNFTSMVMLRYTPETRRIDDIVRSCPNGLPWDYVGDFDLPKAVNRYYFIRTLRIFDDKYAPLGQVKVPGEIFDKNGSYGL